MNEILPYIRRGQAISLESTTYPGTTDEIIAPMIETRKFVIGEDIHLIYSPEREDPGNKDFSLQSIPKVVGGMTKNCLKAGLDLYSKIVNSVIPVSSTRVAEMTKLLENIHRSVNIGLVNEMKIISDSWKAKEYGLNTRFIELAGEINLNMPNWVINKTIEALNNKKISVSNSKILILGVAYKKNVSDIRESPSIRIIEKLISLNANISYSDEYVEQITELAGLNKPLKSKVISPKLLQSCDCILLTTDHDNFDYELIQRHSKMIIDTRGKFKKSKKIVQA